MPLIESLVKEGWLKTPKIIEAFKKIKRLDFLLDQIADKDDKESLGNYDEALPIGYNQTISQPRVVAFMMELLEPKEGEKVLDIGSGSGWTTALLAEIVSHNGKNKDGKVIGIEIISDLVHFGIRNVFKYDFINSGIAKIILGDGSKGYTQEAPYDKILCSAALQHKVPDEWFSQLKVGGAIVYPKGESIFKLTKLADGCRLSEAVKDEDFAREEYPGFVFVPLVNYEF